MGEIWSETYGTPIALLTAFSVLAFALAGCTTTASSTPSRPADAEPAAPAASGKMYKGKVQRGYEITFIVSPDGKQISNVHANVLESCTGSSTSRTITFFMEGPYDVGADGSVTAEEHDLSTKYTSKFTAALKPDGTASGTLIQKGAIAGTACTTYELKWDAQKQ